MESLLALLVSKDRLDEGVVAEELLWSESWLYFGLTNGEYLSLNGSVSGDGIDFGIVVGEFLFPVSGRWEDVSCETKDSESLVPESRFSLSFDTFPRETEVSKS